MTKHDIPIKWHWFRGTRRPCVCIHFTATTISPILVSMSRPGGSEETETVLCEIPKTVDQYVVPLPSDLDQFQLRLKSDDTSQCHFASFRAGSPLDTAIEDRRASWRWGSWRSMRAQPTAWSGGNLVWLAGSTFPSNDKERHACRLNDPRIHLQPLGLLLTPLDEEEAQGPTEQLMLGPVRQLIGVAFVHVPGQRGQYLKVRVDASKSAGPPDFAIVHHHYITGKETTRTTKQATARSKDGRVLDFAFPDIETKDRLEVVWPSQDTVKFRVKVFAGEDELPIDRLTNADDLPQKGDAKWEPLLTIDPPKYQFFQRSLK